MCRLLVVWRERVVCRLARARLSQWWRKGRRKELEQDGDTRGGQSNKDTSYVMAMAKVNLIGVVRPAHSSAAVGNRTNGTNTLNNFNDFN